MPAIDAPFLRRLTLGVSAAGLFLSVLPSLYAGEPAGFDPARDKPFPPEALTDASPRWRVSAGAIWRDIGDVRFHTGSRSHQLRLPNLVGGEFRHLPGAAGAPDSLGPRAYDDGFVRTDAGSGRDGFTWNWGYDNSSQVRGDQLVFSLAQGSQRTVSQLSNVNPSSWSEGSEFEPGPYIEIDRLFPIASGLSAGPQLKLSFINSESHNTSSDFAHRQSSEKRQFELTDRFDLDGIIPPLAPYQGTEAGPGPLLNNLPEQRSIASQVDEHRTADFFNRIDESFDLDLVTFGAGPQVEYDRGPLFVQGAAGLAVNVADWEASHRETLYASRDGSRPVGQRRWTAHESGTDVLLGAYVQAKLGVQLTQRLSVAGFARYDWTQSLTGSVGPSSFEVDLDGLSAGVVVGFTF